MKKIDVIISVATKDCLIVQKNLQYIYENLNSDNIYILTNLSNTRLFNTQVLQKYNAILIDENKLIEGLSFQNIHSIVSKIYPKYNLTGWYFQQFLKMGFALSQYAKEDYLIWDADTFPLHKLTFKQNNKYFFTIKSEYHKPYFSCIKKILNMEKSINGSFIAEHMIINSSVMRELIQYISQSSCTGNNWIEKILNSVDSTATNGFSEFETYGTYVTIKYPNLYEQRKLRTNRNAGNLYGRGVTKSQLKKLSNSYDTVSFEERDTPPFPKSLIHYLIKIYLRLWAILNKK